MPYSGPEPAAGAGGAQARAPASHTLPDTPPAGQAHAPRRRSGAGPRTCRTRAPSPRRAKAVQNLAPRAANRTAQRSLTGPGEELIPLDLVVNFYRGVPAAGRLAAATARVTHRGRRFVVAEGEVAGL